MSNEGMATLVFQSVSAGASEMLVGKAIRDRRDQAFVSVKFGALRSAAGPFLGFDCRPNAVKNFCAYSLRRLGVEVIDLYQPARVDPGVPVEDTIGAVADLIKEGKVRRLGVSEYNAAQLRRAHAIHPVAALEIEYSLASRFIEAEILPTARELGVSVAAYSVITPKGLLTGDMPPQLAPGDERAAFPRFQGENLKKNIAAVDGLKRVADAKGATPAQIAIAWVLAQGSDIVSVIGMSSRKRVPENLKAADIVLLEDDLSQLDALFRPGAIAGGRYPRRPRSGRGLLRRRGASTTCTKERLLDQDLISTVAGAREALGGDRLDPGRKRVAPPRTLSRGELHLLAEGARRPGAPRPALHQSRLEHVRRPDLPAGLCAPADAGMRALRRRAGRPSHREHLGGGPRLRRRGGAHAGGLGDRRGRRGLPIASACTWTIRRRSRTSCARIA